MDHRQLERFVDVIKTGSLSRTAKRLNISQPALSKSLRQLEDQLAARLLNRTPRGVHPTKFGEAFYERALVITAEFRRARDELEHLRGSTSGEVALGVTPGPGVLDRIVPKAIARVAKPRVALRFNVRSGTIPELLPALKRGDLDLLFTVLDERLNGVEVKSTLVFEDHFVIVLRSRHPLLARKTIPLKELLGFRWVLLQDALPLWRAIVDSASDRQIQRIAPIESNSVVFVRSMVSQTDYVGILPHYAVQASRDNEVTSIPLERIVEHRLFPRLVRPMGLVHLRENDLTPAGHLLLRSMVTVCHELGLSQSKIGVEPLEARTLRARR
jgi:DNA-binding transcriptional LysR family regulator